MEQQLLVLLCKWRFNHLHDSTRSKVSKMVKSWQLDQHPSNFFNQKELVFSNNSLTLCIPNFSFWLKRLFGWVTKCLSLNKPWSSCHDSAILDILVLPLSWHKNRLPKSSNLQLQAEQAKRQAEEEASPRSAALSPSQLSISLRARSMAPCLGWQLEEWLPSQLCTKVLSQPGPEPAVSANCPRAKPHCSAWNCSKEEFQQY